jgi:hypothetical protein
MSTSPIHLITLQLVTKYKDVDRLSFWLTPRQQTSKNLLKQINVAEYSGAKFFEYQHRIIEDPRYFYECH